MASGWSPFTASTQFGQTNIANSAGQWSAWTTSIPTGEVANYPYAVAYYTKYTSFAPYRQ